MRPCRRITLSEPLLPEPSPVKPMIVSTAPMCFTCLQTNSNRFGHCPIIFHLTRNYFTIYDKKGERSYKGSSKNRGLRERRATKPTTDRVACHDDKDVQAHSPLQKGR